MGDIDIHIGESDDSEAFDEPIIPPAPIIIPSPVPMDDSAVLERLAALEAKLDTALDFIDRIETLEEMQADALDEIANDDTEDISDMLNELDLEDREELADGATEAGAAPEANGNTEQPDDGTPAGSEHSADESPRATHPWWKPLRS